MIGDFERISDHAVNVVESAEEIRDKNVTFSEQAQVELETMKKAVAEILGMTLDALESGEIDKALAIEPLEQVIDYLRDQIKLNHTIRLQKNLCSIELGFILSDILTNLERVSDHCSNIAGCLVEMSRKEMLDIHSYTHQAHKDSGAYAAQYKAYMDKYSLASAE
jgi:phosphate:Na+ symporter